MRKRKKRVQKKITKRIDRLWQDINMLLAGPKYPTKLLASIDNKALKRYKKTQSQEK